MMEFDDLPFLQIAVSFNIAVYLVHTYLDVRQRQALLLPKPPAEVAHLYSDDPNRFPKQQAYNLAKWRFSFVHGIFDALLNNSLLALGFLPRTWDLAGTLLARFGFSSGEAWQTIFWVLLTGAVSMAVSIPWSLYRTFVLEEKFGFNRTTPRTFITDLVKSVALGFVFVPPIVGGVTYILQRSSPYIALYLWGFMLAVALFMMTIYPTVIQPLFNKFAPLEEGSLRGKIEALAGSLKFPLTKLYVIDGSKRSAHSNAYMYGFFKNKRIVLFDTLIQQCSEDQVVAVLAHELGHWKLRHTPILFAAGQLVFLAQMSLFTLLRSSAPLYRSFGFRPGQQPVFAALLMFQELIGPVDEVLGMLNNMVTRAFEFAADGFGVRMGKGVQLKEALCVLDKENMGAPNVDPWYSAYHYSHPPLPERLRAITAKLKKDGAEDKKVQ